MYLIKKLNRFGTKIKNMDCLFCKIVSGEVKSNKIYEDELTYAFLDIFPVTKGHSLVIPKNHAQHIEELDDD